MQAVATLRNLGFSWPGNDRPVLKNITWSVQEGARYLLQGPNGAGKSSLLGLLAGIYWPCAGEIFWQGKNGPDHSRIFGRSISSLVSPAMQENIQRQNLSSTFEDALLGAFDDSPFSFAAEETDPEKLRLIKSTARELQCEHLLKMPLSSLSQGELRIMLCMRALLRKPRLCLLDEAFDGLDERRRRAFFSALVRLAPSCAIVLATHRADALPDAEKLHLEQGRLLKERTARCPVSQPRPQAAGLQPAESGPILLELRNVNVFVDRAPVLRDIHWRTRVGEHWRISGENGSGKSTLLRLLAGEEQAHCAGRIERPLGKGHFHPLTLDEIRAAIRLVSDAGQALYGYDINGLELVLSGFEQSVGLYREYSNEEKRLAAEIMGKFFTGDEAAGIASTSIRKLSSGQLRRLHLARALLGAPKILLLDEAASGLDAGTRKIWFEELEKLSPNVQIIMVSHHEEDAPAFINREARMTNGRLEILK